MKVSWSELKEGEKFYTKNCTMPNVFMFKYKNHVAFMNNRGLRVITHTSNLIPLKEPNV